MSLFEYYDKLQGSIEGIILTKYRITLLASELRTPPPTIFNK